MLKVKSIRQNYYNIIYCVLNQNIFESRSVKTASDNVSSAYQHSLYKKEFYFRSLELNTFFSLKFVSNFPKNLNIIKIKHKSDAVMTEGD